jgi:hypothetical protein
VPTADRAAGAISTITTAASEWATKNRPEIGYRH